MAKFKSGDKKKPNAAQNSANRLNKRGIIATRRVLDRTASK
jgi:hypothetical protein